MRRMNLVDRLISVLIFFFTLIISIPGGFLAGAAGSFCVYDFFTEDKQRHPVLDLDEKKRSEIRGTAGLMAQQVAREGLGRELTRQEVEEARKIGGDVVDAYVESCQILAVLDELTANSPPDAVIYLSGFAGIILCFIIILSFFLHIRNLCLKRLRISGKYSRLIRNIDYVSTRHYLRSLATAIEEIKNFLASKRGVNMV